MDFLRQSGLIKMERLQELSASLIGAGALGSFSALALSKMGLGSITIYDEDGVSEHNLPNQFYRKSDLRKFKVDALKEIISEYADTKVEALTEFFSSQELKELVIVTTDSMSSRKLVWEEFKKQTQSKYLIEARMGAELGRIYIIKKTVFEGGMIEKGGFVEKKDIEFYESTLYSDDKVKPLPCTEKTILYNVLMIASLIGRAVKSIVNSEGFPKELIFDMKHIHPHSFMITE